MSRGLQRPLLDELRLGSGYSMHHFFSSNPPFFIISFPLILIEMSSTQRMPFAEFR